MTSRRPRRSPVFFSRKFPPSVGGMETLARGVWHSMAAVRPDAVLIAHGGPNRTMPWWFLGATVRLGVLLLRRRVEVVLTGDALMNAALAPLLRLTRTRRATMVMGLDLTYEGRVYRMLVRPQVRQTPLVIAISEATGQVARDLGVDPDRVRVVRLGVPEPPDVSRGDAAVDVRRRLGLDKSATVLLTLGRLVRRKGACWFVESVLPALPPATHYVLAGSGPEEAGIVAAAARAGVADRVHLLGLVDDGTRELLLAGADLFVQPNIPVPGDMEGFGLVTIEAALRGTPVVAADIEGLKDAVVPGRTGVLLPAADADAWVRGVGDLVADRDGLPELGRRFREAASELYSESAMGKRLGALLDLTDTTAEGRPAS